jgi:hypothetical protein
MSEQKQILYKSYPDCYSRGIYCNSFSGHHKKCRHLQICKRCIYGLKSPHIFSCPKSRKKEKKENDEREV